MNEQQRIVYIMAQMALFNAEIAMMQAENQFRTNCGNQIAYGETEFARVIEKYEPTLCHNGVITELLG